MNSLSIFREVNTRSPDHRRRRRCCRALSRAKLIQKENCTPALQEDFDPSSDIQRPRDLASRVSSVAPSTSARPRKQRHSAEFCASPDPEAESCESSVRGKISESRESLPARASRPRLVQQNSVEPERPQRPEAREAIVRGESVQRPSSSLVCNSISRRSSIEDDLRVLRSAPLPSPLAQRDPPTVLPESLQQLLRVGRASDFSISQRVLRDSHASKRSPRLELAIIPRERCDWTVTAMRQAYLHAQRIHRRRVHY